MTVPSCKERTEHSWIDPHLDLKLVIKRVLLASVRDVDTGKRLKRAEFRYLIEDLDPADDCKWLEVGSGDGIYSISSARAANRDGPIGGCDRPLWCCRSYDGDIAHYAHCFIQ